MASLKNAVLMGTSTLPRPVFGLITFTIMDPYLGSLKFNPLNSVFYGLTQLVQVVVRKTGGCLWISGRKSVDTSLQTMTAEIA